MNAESALFTFQIKAICIEQLKERLPQQWNMLQDLLRQNTQICNAFGLDEVKALSSSGKSSQILVVSP